MTIYRWGQPTLQTNVIGNAITANSVVSMGNAGIANVNTMVPFFTSYNGGLSVGQVSSLLVNANLTYNGNALVVGSAGNTVTINNGGNVTATGNIQASYFIGDGSQLTGLPSGYGNAQVTNYAEFGWAGNIIPAIDNVYSLGSSSRQWKDLWVSNSTIYINQVPLSSQIINGNSTLFYANAPVVTSGPNAAPITTNITTSANIAANSLIGNVISSTGNVYGSRVVASYLWGDGSNITNINASSIIGAYGNANVAAYLPTDTTITNITSNVSILQGNVVNLTTSLANTNSNVTNNTSNISILQGNVVSLTTSLANTNSNVANLQTAVTSLTGNVYGNSNVASYLPTYSGTVKAGNLSVTGSAVILGNLSVQGNITFTNSNVITTNDLYIQLANNQSTLSGIDGAGLEVGSANLVNWTYSSTANAWTTNVGLSSQGNISAPYFIGNGSQLTGLPASYGNANVTTLLSNFGSNTILTTGNVTGGNVLTSGVLSVGGIVTIASTAGNVLTTTGNISAGYLYGNGAFLTGLPANYGNSNVTTLLSSGTVSTPIISTGNISGNNISGGYVTIANAVSIPSTAINGTGVTTIYTASSSNVEAVQLTVRAQIGSPASSVQMLQMMIAQDSTGNLSYTVYDRVNTNSSVSPIPVSVTNISNFISVALNSSSTTYYTVGVTEFAKT